MFERVETGLSGCFELLPTIHGDCRGVFIKTFHKDMFNRMGVKSEIAEQYYTVSKRGVLRGMHFQAPPSDHAKTVFCTQGSVFDVVMDIRRGSRTYGEVVCFELNEKKRNMIYMESGFAHGFYTLSDHATLVYSVTSAYDPNNDHGILWNSCDIPWPGLTPIVSGRDQDFTKFSDFKSPFVV